MLGIYQINNAGNPGRKLLDAISIFLILAWVNHLERFKPLIVGMEVMPSMRALMTAGKALEKDHVAGYNCAYTAVDSLRAFDECLYILMCGTGLGFSVERQHIQKLPVIAEDFHETDTVIVVRDSKIGWAKLTKS
tara:strand:- start:857 stop:1261 length:405 start_codon:yes stop_codon:yes gene_type:complete